MGERNAKGYRRSYGKKRHASPLPGSVLRHGTMSIPTVTVMAVVTDLHRTFLIHTRVTGVPALGVQGSVFIFLCGRISDFFIIAQAKINVKGVSSNFCKILSPFAGAAIQ